jgi:hypothetical protein
MNRLHRIAARLVFAIGLVLMTLGIAFLLGTMTGISRLSVLGSFLFVIIGALFAVLAIKWNKQTIYLFFASFFILVGLFLFLSTMSIIPITFPQGWPLLSVFAGLALLPAGWRHYRRLRYSYLIPSLAFVILGCILLIFSLKIVSFSFKVFIIDWWPLLLALTGIILILHSVSSGNRNDPP